MEKGVGTMDKFKLRPGLHQSYDITTSEYETQTNRAFPYCQRDKKGVLHYYAVCPECNNPIVIISLHKKTSGSPRPYGRHIKRSVPGLAYYSQTAYESCPYTNPNWQEEKLSANSHAAIAKLKFLREHFDLVMHILREQTGIRYSAQLSKKLLQNYLQNEGWLYHYSTVNNLPWTLPLSSPAITLKGRYLDRDSKLFKALSKRYPAILDDNRIKYKDNPYYPKFLFLKYQQSLVQHNQHLQESVEFRVINQRGKNVDILYQQKLSLDPNLMIKSIFFGDKNKHSAKRLEIAKELIKFPIDGKAAEDSINKRKISKVRNHS